jgi:hypothetical protein
LLTNVSLAFSNNEFVALKVYPEIPVSKQSDKWLIYSKDRMRVRDDHRRPGAEANDYDWTLSSDQYFADSHAMRGTLPDEWKNNADPILADMDVDLTEQLTENVGLIQEVNLVTSLVANAQTVSEAGTKWDNNANDPIALIDAQKEVVMKGCGKLPNKMLLSRPVFRALRNNANVVGRVTGAQSLDKANVTAAQLAAVLEVDEVIVADAVKLTSAEGQTDTMDFVWGKLAALFYRPPSPGKRTVAWGYTMNWNIGMNGRLVYRFPEPKRHSDLIETQVYYDQKEVAHGAGILFSNCVT